MSGRGGWVDYRAVKAAVRWEDLLHFYRVDGLQRQGQDAWRGRCPIHGRGGTNAFHVSLDKKAFQCFYCGAHGNVLDFVAALEQCSLREAALRLQGRLASGAWAAEGRRPGGEPKLVPGKEGNRPLGFTLWGVEGRHPYLASRGVQGETARYFGVGFFAGRGLLSGRIVIPIHDELGRLVAYGGRSIDGRPPRYKLPPGFQKSRVLFNLHRAAGCGQDSVVVVEGFFDCMTVHQAGFPSVVALLGTTLSRFQEGLLLERFRRVVLLLDGDEAGQAASAALANRLAGKCLLTVLPLPSGEQPDRLSAQQIRRLLKTEAPL